MDEHVPALQDIRNHQEPSRPPKAERVERAEGETLLIIGLVPVGVQGSGARCIKVDLSLERSPVWTAVAKGANLVMTLSTLYVSEYVFAEMADSFDAPIRPAFGRLGVRYQDVRGGPFQ